MLEKPARHRSISATRQYQRASFCRMFLSASRLPRGAHASSCSPVYSFTQVLWTVSRNNSKTFSKSPSEYSLRTILPFSYKTIGQTAPPCLTILLTCAQALYTVIYIQKRRNSEKHAAYHTSALIRPPLLNRISLCRIRIQLVLRVRTTTVPQWYYTEKAHDVQAVGQKYCQNHGVPKCAFSFCFFPSDNLLTKKKTGAIIVFNAQTGKPALLCI